MSHAVVALQEHADSAADAFCRRFVKPPRRHGKAIRHNRPCIQRHPRPKIGKFYRPRDHAASPFFKIVRDNFDEFERVYPGRFAYETIRETYLAEVGEDAGVAGAVAEVQSFGDLLTWNVHCHMIISEGVFTESGHFVKVPQVAIEQCRKRWEEKLFALLLREGKIAQDVVDSMRKWEHSGFSVDNQVRIEANDHEGMQRLVEYIARCPFSLTRMIRVNADGKVIYRAGNPNCLPFPRKTPVSCFTSFLDFGRFNGYFGQ